MKRKSLYFHGNEKIEIRDEPLPFPEPDEVVVETLLSGISAGTESLIYHGNVPKEMTMDPSLKAYSGTFRYPLKYGYALVGNIVETGAEIQKELRDTRVFAFHPHETYFTASVNDLIPLPETLSSEDAVFLANMETAVNFLMDGQPLIGERVGVFGQGVVGLLTTALLNKFPLALVITVDFSQLRRQFSVEFGADHALNPAGSNILEEIRNMLRINSSSSDFDLVYELSGSPDALNDAIAVTGYEGRLIIGSWYGIKTASLDLGSAFHRSKIRMISSQVSSIHSRFSGRWNKKRRMAVALNMLSNIRPAKLITHRFPVHRAQDAFNLLENANEDTIQIVITYQ